MNKTQKFLALPKEVVETAIYWAKNSFYNEVVKKNAHSNGHLYRIYVCNFIGSDYKEYTGIIVKDAGNNILFNHDLKREKLLVL